MRVKPGVKLLGIQAPTVVGMMIADGVYKSYANMDMTVTSVLDGTHKADSLHYKGLAFDARTKNMIGVNMHSLLMEIRTALGNEWDVIYENEGTENEHFHLEHDVA